MKKKFTLLCGSVLFILSPLVFADACPQVGEVVWQGNHWASRDGGYLGISEYSAGKDAIPTSFGYAFWRGDATAGLIVCSYNTNASKPIEMIHSTWNVPKPTATTWHVAPAPGWHGNSGLICWGSAGIARCRFDVTK